MSEDMRFETAAIHAGQDPDTATGAVIVPIYQTSTYAQEEVGKHKGFEYSRTDNPTRRALETCLATLEGTADALSFSSGMAAITTLALTLKSGDRVLIPDDAYGGTYRLFARVLADLGVGCDTVNMADLEATRAAFTDRTRLVIAETPTNPLLKILDLEALAGMCRASDVVFAVDNTFATPFVQRPLDLGADVAIYSATKYLGGHSDLVMGTIATSDTELTERLHFLRNAAGTGPGPFDCWLLLRGLKTLALRMRAHSLGAARVARWLSEQPGVARVHYPGLPEFPGHEIATRQMSEAGEPLYGGVISIEFDSEERALEVCKKTKLFFLAESLGGVESLIEHPARMTHMSVTDSPLAVPPTLLRLSVGIEHPDDLIADLEQALG
ncbi:MAG: cystathionine gamma-synthase [Actinomycetota bacterium]